MRLDEIFFQSALQLASEWRADVAPPHEKTLLDPVADTRAHDATKLEQLVARLRDEHAYVTAEAFAKMHKRTVQTARSWARNGRLGPNVFRDDVGEWMIPADAKPPRRPRRSST